MAEGRRESLAGSGVAHGIAIGRAHLLARSELDVRQYTIERRDVVHEIGRLTTGFNAVRAELDQLKSSISADAPSEVRAFVNVHRMLLEDSTASPRRRARSSTREQKCNAEWALKTQLDEGLLAQFEDIEDEYLRERANDIAPGRRAPARGAGRGHGGSAQLHR